MWSAEASSTGAPTLSLAIQNVTSLSNGVPTVLELDQRGATIGRSATVDWCLPDPRSHISSQHCTIVYDGGSYKLLDVSTNGTFLNGATERPKDAVVLRDGDRVAIGHYEITVSIRGGAAAASAAPAPAAPAWNGWGDTTPVAAAPPSDWGAPPPQSAISGQGPMSGQWAPPAAPAPPPATASAWEATPAAPAPASNWSSAVPDTPPPPSANDVWGRIASDNVVDWARGGFGQPAPPPADPLGLAPRPGAALAPPPRAAAAPNTFPAPAPQQTRSAPAGGATSLQPFFEATGLSRDQIKASDTEVLSAAGTLLRRLVAGLVVMLEARARAKSQLGAQSTALEFNGNNPLKFARTPEGALMQMLSPPERGFMAADRAVEDAYQDLQSHQIATLRAMQGALKATLDRFSPTAIKARAEAGGVLRRIIPGARDAALWQAYEREFGGVAHGSDEAFMDMFAKEFKRAYDEQSAKGRRN